MAGGVLIDIVVIICVFWVFFDAASHNIGSYVVADGIQKGYRKGLHPVAWAILSFLILPSAEKEVLTGNRKRKPRRY